MERKFRNNEKQKQNSQNYTKTGKFLRNYIKEYAKNIIRTKSENFKKKSFKKSVKLREKGTKFCEIT